MNNEEILMKVFNKITDNGFPFILDDKKYGYFFKDMFDSEIFEHGYYRYIFSHDFAKAFWGIEEDAYSHPLNENSEPIYLEAWKYHLMCMVLEKEPLKYLEKFL